VVCPLNGATDMRNTCERCRRCFDGKAVNHSQEAHGHEGHHKCQA
jgi:hypothetical protein